MYPPQLLPRFAYNVMVFLALGCAISIAIRIAPRKEFLWKEKRCSPFETELFGSQFFSDTSRIQLSYHHIHADHKLASLLAQLPSFLPLTRNRVRVTCRVEVVKKCFLCNQFLATFSFSFFYIRNTHYYIKLCIMLPTMMRYIMLTCMRIWWLWLDRRRIGVLYHSGKLLSDLLYYCSGSWTIQSSSLYNHDR